MYQVLLLTVLCLVAASYQTNPVIDQLPIFKNTTDGTIGILTTSAGSPIESSYAGSTLNKNLNTNPYFMDSLTNFVRENVPERIVHMKGAGAFGYFETNHKVSHICAADFLSKIGKKTPLVVRFSVGVTGKGGPDTTATPMGFAMKFYTKEGNFDLLGLNFPMFVLKDPSIFPPFIHVMKRNPATNIADVNMFWDFATTHPECLNMVMMLYGDQGIHKTYRHMPGYPIQTYQVYNAKGTSYFIRWRFFPVLGLEYLNSTEAASNACSDLDYYSRDLYTEIANGNYPKWNVSIQILTQDDVQNAGFDVFDTSKYLPEDTYPFHPVGQITLNRNPKNYHEDIELLALNPGNLVPGILGCPDKVFEARQMFYRQAQSHRLGVNYNKITVNCPYRSKVFTYNRDGVPPLLGNGYDSPNYFPNSFNGPIPYNNTNMPCLLEIVQDEPNNVEQGKAYCETQMTTESRTRLAQTIVATLCYAADVLQERAVKAFSNINTELGELIAAALEAKNC